MNTSNPIGLANEPIKLEITTKNLYSVMTNFFYK
jgi:hypothetical protein